jgi:protein SCO1/2
MYPYRLLLFGLLLAGCARLFPKDELPILGPRKAIEKVLNGTTVTDTLYHTIPDFAFLNQDSQWVRMTDMEGNVLVADFFFTSCPTICPVMKTQMLRVYEQFKEEDRLRLVSFSIDPAHDTVALLRAYAATLGVAAPRWNMLTGDRDSIYALGQGSFMVTAKADASEPGGIVHSGAFILIDTQRRIRGYYDGTVQEEVNRLMQDIQKLLSDAKK